MMSVQAKFLCSAVEDKPDYQAKEIKMHAVSAGDGKGNESWSKYTPSGSLTMWITNPLAYDQFEEGKQYYLSFELAE